MWKYKNRVIRVGKPWTDDEGTKHPYNWVNWDFHRKKVVGVRYIGEAYNGS